VVKFALRPLRQKHEEEKMMRNGLTAGMRLGTRKIKEHQKKYDTL